MLKIIIFIVLIFTIVYLFTNFIPKRENGRVKYIIPILFTLLILGIISFILPRFGLNPIVMFQTIISKIIQYLPMLRGII